MSNEIVPETSVPPGETPAAVCPYCERPFRRERQWTLHVGEVHSEREGPRDGSKGSGDASFRAQYDAALEAEAEDLFVFHLKVFAALGAVYAGFIVLAIVAFSLAG
ncbi:hypothetical protein AUR64_06990 [Haloprofundus marisrubri]|uniref:C2H2-type domain-containing protein n=1 Tax=Haloprofundus marisrubri TaxID=1514971 RepID=A0A0W1RC01_9EURY|nr:hypothetical protein [Haloprofundus marisrubri]KTG10917.1 hypothetical protein AUR64_06990 [Haloprofundus marisrubri]